MPQRFLSIKNFEKYQTYKHSNPPWFKIHKCIFGDREFSRMSTSSKFLFIGLIHLACESNNKIYNDPTWIAQRLYIDRTEVNLTPLYKAGFLISSNIRRILSDQSSSGQDSIVQVSATPPLPLVNNHKRGSREISDDDKPTEKHIALSAQLRVDLGPEWGKFKNYCLAHGKRYANFEAAFRNWLVKASEMKGVQRVV